MNLHETLPAGNDDIDVDAGDETATPGIAKPGTSLVAEVEPTVEGLGNMAGSTRWSLVKKMGSAINSVINKALGDPPGRRALPEIDPQNYDPMEDLYPGREKDLDMVQSSNVGDCYMIAAIYTLKHNDVFVGALRKIIQLKVSEQDVLGWGVSFLGDPNGNSVVITPAELKGQKILDPKTNAWEYRYPVKGGKGDIILERAFGRRRKEMKEAAILSESAEKDMTFSVVVGGYGNEFLSFVLGDRVSRKVDIGLENVNMPLDTKSRQRKATEKLLMEAALNPEHFIITANTPRRMVTPYKKSGNHREFGDGFRYFMDPEFFFYQQHAYAVMDIDSVKQEVTIVNPHDTANKKKTLSWNKFMEIFSDISAVQLNPNNAKTDLNINLPAWKSPPAEVELRGWYGEDHEDPRIMIDLKDLKRKTRDEDDSNRRMIIPLDDLIEKQDTSSRDIIKSIESESKTSEQIKNDISALGRKGQREDINAIKRHCIEKRHTLKYNGSSSVENKTKMKLYEQVVSDIENVERQKGWIQ